MTERKPVEGDRIIVGGESFRVFFVSEQFGLDYEDENHDYLGTVRPEDFKNITYADEAFGWLNNVSHPSHYTSHPSGVETIEITKHESFLRGNLLKYVLRAPYKGNELEDMQKAQQYLSWEIERLQAL